MLLSSLLTLRDVSAFQGDDRSWQYRSSMPTPRTGIAAVAVNDQVFTFGGQNEEGAIVATVERFDPASNSWTTLPDMNQARFNAAATVLNGTVYING